VEGAAFVEPPLRSEARNILILKDKFISAGIERTSRLVNEGGYRREHTNLYKAIDHATFPAAEHNIALGRGILFEFPARREEMAGPQNH